MAVGTDGRAVSGVVRSATMVTGCWQCGQYWVAVGSNGSLYKNGWRDGCQVTGFGCCGSSGSEGRLAASPSRRARSSARAWSRLRWASLR